MPAGEAQVIFQSMLDGSDGYSNSFECLSFKLAGVIDGLRSTSRLER